ncbi:MAG TPA: zinc-dependent metalloprotease family protein [Pyrinomonadaceae bacterium]|nr:zinc-dependent metalloprotease family protein [Pyrinomonadaceae bacterium]
MFTKTFPGILTIVLFFLVAGTAVAQVSPDRVWTAIDESRIAENSEKQVSPTRYRTFKLDKNIIGSILDNAPKEFSGQSRFMQTRLTLPTPDGKFERFEIEHSPIVEPGLLAKYPELGRTYIGRGIDDPTSTVRLDFLPGGFHAIVLSPRGTVLVDPYSARDTDNYLVYFKRDVPRKSGFSCDFEGQKATDDMFDVDGRSHEELIPDAASDVISGTQLRTYRLAVAATVEYSAAVGSGTVASVLAAQVLIMNRVNGVYERDLAIRMVMVANNDLIVHLAEPDGYTNNQGTQMLGQNQTNIDTAIGAGNYDIGHVFSTGGGGVATLRVPCTGSKARGVTGLSDPVGDPFAIDYVAHEMGHQWGGNHTMNGCNRNAASAYEVGSGVTIMAYAGICGAQDLADHSIDTFHVKSLEEIVAYSQSGNGNSCALTTPTGNTPPAVAVVGGPTFNIPKQTPFALTASGSDVDGDSVTYDWQEYDLGASGANQVPNSDADGQVRPIFRPFLPTAGGTRTFPQIQHVLSTANVPPATYGESLLTGEVLPAISRAMTFQVVARDNHANGGGINSATASVVVNGLAGPFNVTSPNTGATWQGNTPQTVTWNVANTNISPINTFYVRILFSSDGGQTFPTVIENSTPNDGTAVITLPNIPTTMGRIKIEAEGNIYFDISDVNFTVTTGVATPTKAPFDFDGDNRTDLAIFRPSNGQWWMNKSSNGSTLALEFGTSSDVIAPADYTGDGLTDVAIWRPASGAWFVLRSEDFTYFAFPFGVSGDVPVAADFDGDQKADPTIYRPSTSVWYVNQSTGGTTIAAFGSPGDKPVPGDYDGDSKADFAVFRPTGINPTWWVRSSSDASVMSFGFGTETAMPVQGFYTGDNKTDIAYYNPTTNYWFILRSEDFSYYTTQFGTNGDIPVPGDYDGDGKSDTAVFRPSNSTWYVNQTTGGVFIGQFGLSTDKPVPSAFVP